MKSQCLLSSAQGTVHVDGQVSECRTDQGRALHISPKSKSKSKLQNDSTDDSVGARSRGHDWTPAEESVPAVRSLMTPSVLAAQVNEYQPDQGRTLLFFSKIEIEFQTPKSENDQTDGLR